MIIEVGKTYKVTIEDCCVEGSFTSKVEAIYESWTKLDSIDEQEYGAQFVFENGVSITQQGGLTFKWA